MIAVSIAIFIVSAATIALELVLVRALSIAHWHHFSYLVISTALLGFAAGGTLVTLASGFFQKTKLKALWASALALALAAPIVFKLSQNVPFDEPQLIWDRRQILYLFEYYMLFFVAFFSAGTFVALAFTAFSKAVHRLYFFNMTGSGFGAAAAIALMYGHSPEQLLLVISAAAFIAAAVIAAKITRTRLVFTLILAPLFILAFTRLGPFNLKIIISENKPLTYYRALPDFNSIAVRHSPIARLDCIRAQAIREFPGLQIGYTGNLPPQTLIVTDAAGSSPVNHFKNLEDLNYCNHLTSALPYHLIENPTVCIIGAGGGSDVAQALALGSTNVTAVEMNQQIIQLMQGPLKNTSSELYNRENVKILNAEGRTFLHNSKTKFDIINISMLDATGSAAGLYTLNQSHLYTVQAIQQALLRLTPDGILSITRTLKTPPRDALKMLATIAQALRQIGQKEPEKNIIFIRNWSSATIIASPKPFTTNSINAARNFANKRSFDTVHFPGIKLEHANRFHVLQQPTYYNAAQKILSENRREFFDRYIYYIKPATDNRPYYFNFFKFKSLSHLKRNLPGQWRIFSEWGYIVLAATLSQAALASTVLIILPLLITKPLRTSHTKKIPTLAYFLLLGLAYMSLEIAFIDKMNLLIGHPVFGLAVTLVGFLCFSGLGSLTAGRIINRFKNTQTVIWTAILLTTCITIIEITTFYYYFDHLVAFDRPARIAIGLTLTALPAFFMGMPFPSALSRIAISTAPILPWAWAINGFASVTGAVLATMLTISYGFNALALIALAAYLLAAAISRRGRP